MHRGSPGVRYGVGVSLTQAPGPADHNHEPGARSRRVERDGPTDASDMPGVAAQLTRLQTSAGNQAVNRLLQTVSKGSTGSMGIARLPLVQRDDPPLQTPAADPNATKPPPDFSKVPWPQLLPTAHGAAGASITKIDLHTPGNAISGWGTGQAPTFSYMWPSRK